MRNKKFKIYKNDSPSRGENYRKLNFVDNIVDNEKIKPKPWESVKSLKISQKRESEVKTQEVCEPLFPRSKKLPNAISKCESKVNITCDETISPQLVIGTKLSRNSKLKNDRCQQISNLKAKTIFFEIFSKRVAISKNSVGQCTIGKSVTSLTFSAQEPTLANRRADHRICLEKPATGHEGRALIGQKEQDERVGRGAQPMGGQETEARQPWTSS